jgi:hypothetical protein
MPKELRLADQLITDAIDSKANGIVFTEVMSGFINTQDEVDDFDIAYDAATAAGSSARFFLSCHSWNTNQREYRPN